VISIVDILEIRLIPSLFERRPRCCMLMGLRPSFEVSDGRKTLQFVYCFGSKFSSTHTSRAFCVSATTFLPFGLIHM
jgi:hypothetical protein